MTNQEKKDYLIRYRDNEREIRRLQNEIQRWKDSAYITSVKYTGAGGGTDGQDKLQVNVERLVRLQNRLTAQMRARIQLRDEIEDAIESVPDDRLQLLLRYRYIEGLTFERIAVELNYSWRQICNLHGKALNEVKIA
ncbi:sigma factor-like helix-turn-helix DNA-binding protein [Anaerotruncus rubiinfantis]|uniref:sigma factor-like helix-turn-helix DNA-binding protein n=1 Tax=Anaerotruncus rubiinfantis TaxID=1720200 RepID=UPI00189B7AD4|nr:sigma factor-like helix-turn-helix DNA-binding protein [Anaerotruncus rubiinfantis]